MLNLYKSNLIAKQEFVVRRFIAEKIDEYGYRSNTYGEPEAVKGIVQFVPKNVYEKNGLDYTKEYLEIHTDDNIACIDRGVNGDKITYQGVDYLAKSDSNADKYGFRSVTAVRV